MTHNERAWTWCNQVSLFYCICTWIVYACVCMCRHAQPRSTCGGQKSMPRFIPSPQNSLYLWTLHPVCWDITSHWTRICHFGWAGKVLLPLSSQLQDYRHFLPLLNFPGGMSMGPNDQQALYPWAVSLSFCFWNRNQKSICWRQPPTPTEGLWWRLSTACFVLSYYGFASMFGNVLYALLETGKVSVSQSFS